MLELIVEPFNMRSPTHGFFHSLEEAARFELSELAHAASKKRWVFEYENVDSTTFCLDDVKIDVLKGPEDPFSCSCDDFIDNQCNSCIHCQALKKALANKSFFRKTPIVNYQSYFQGIELFGDFSPAQFHELGLSFNSDGEYIVSDTTVFQAKMKSNPELFSQSVHNYYSRSKLLTLSTHLDDFKIKREPFPFQKEGIQFLAEKGRAILADDLGLGKTAQSIAAAEILLHNKLIDSVLIICPASVKGQWENEIKICTNRSVRAFHSVKDYLKYYLKTNTFPQYNIFSYELIKRNIEITNLSKFGLVILDEAQKIKNANTIGYKTISQIKSDYLFALSGTVIDNKLEDLWNLMQIVDSQFLGPRWKFNYKYCTFNDDYGKIIGHKNMSELHKKIKLRVLRREKKDVLKDLPEMLEVYRYVTLTPQQKQVEEKYVDIALDIMVRASTRELSFQEQQAIQQCLVKARLACNAPELVGVQAKSSPKIDELRDILDEIQPSDEKKVIIFSEWEKMLQLVIPVLQDKKLDYVLFTGSVQSAHRQKLIDEFTNNPKKVIFLSTDAGGVGLNLQTASYVISLDRPWSPARHTQRLGRAHRIGQTKNVLAINICALDCIEYGVDQVMVSKKNIHSNIFNESGEEEIKLATFLDYMKNKGK